MSLEEQIRGLSPVAAYALASAEITDDIEIQELTRGDLNELVPGVQHFKLRKKISELINKSKQDTAKPIALVLNKLREFLPVDVMENALVPGGVLHGYFPILRDVEKQLAEALHFIQAHVGLLESYIGEESMEAQSSAASLSVDSATAGNQPSNVEVQKTSVNGTSGPSALCATDSQHKQCRTEVSGAPNRHTFKETQDETSMSHSYTSGAAGADTHFQKRTVASQIFTGSGLTEPRCKLEKSNFADCLGAGGRNQLSAQCHTDWRSSFGCGSSTSEPLNKKQAVKVHSQVCGKTLNTHLVLMKQVDDLAVGLKREETRPEDCQVIIAFCPITSRVGTDIDAAMSKVPSNKDVILVVMNHTFDHCFVTSQRSASHYKNVVEEVNVLFHDSLGLLQCETNDKAATLIHKALQKYSSTTYTR
ncbi:uncharacterized protein LOC129817437 isoform X2 [Salvelinus fontinalis]|nr:uncharacterized protein LOC129817437 isoform X2 [Salvelinus fontinalis]XP_055728657.1 uncharacterized protein LOC129817437 isoform X2 [Salvelinus fontinalis]XP_055728658.1 uncharacterized protein LOC129817437 isoform X2 [Salvelinus fontinalis]